MLTRTSIAAAGPAEQVGPVSMSCFTRSSRSIWYRPWRGRLGSPSSALEHRSLRTSLRLGQRMLHGKGVCGWGGQAWGQSSSVLEHCSLWTQDQWGGSPLQLLFLLLNKAFKKFLVKWPFPLPSKKKYPWDIIKVGQRMLYGKGGGGEGD